MLPVSQAFKDTIYGNSRYIKARVIVDLDVDIVFEEKLISLNIIEEVSTTSDSLPSNELRFSIDNSDRAYNILDPNSAGSIFKEGQTVRVEFDIEVSAGVYETLPMGKYYLKEWQSDEGTMTSSFTARDILGTLEGKSYNKAKYQNITLYAFAESVLQDIGIASYSIDTKLQSIYTYGLLPILEAREALQYIAVAGRCIIYSDRSGVLTIKQAESIDSASSYLWYCGDDLYCGEAVPEVNKGFSESKIINYDNSYSEPKIELNQEVKAVDIEVHKFSIGATTKQILNAVASVLGAQNVILQYPDGKFYTNISVVVTGATSYAVVWTGANACSIDITASGDVTILVTGNLIEDVVLTFTLDDTDNLKGIALEVKNPLIIDVDTATRAADWILSEGKLRSKYTCTWRQNHALECGDIVLVEDGFNAKKESRIVRQEFDYKGYMSGKSLTKGGV